jgi:beta-barrel assembly-enhancing protease
MRALHFAGPGSSTPVEVEASPLGFRVLGTDGVQPLLPYDAMEITLGGTNGTKLVAKGQVDGVDHELYIDREGLSEELLGIAPDWVTEQVSELGRAQTGRRLGVGASALILFVTASFVGFVLLQLAHTFAVDMVPYSWEISLGESLKGALGEAAPGSVEPKLQRAAEEVVRRLLKTRDDIPYPISVTVLDDAEVNAFALPGGVLFVNRGLISAAESPEELAAVMSHEVSHALLRHSLRQATGQLGTSALISLFLDPSLGLAELGTVVQMAGLKYSRDHETEADSRGLELLLDAQIDPRGAPAFFARLAAEEGSLARATELLSTHPTSAGRSARLEALIAAAPKVEYQALELGESWEALRALARQPGAAAPEPAGASPEADAPGDTPIDPLTPR